jgi:hypothetical protein
VGFIVQLSADRCVFFVERIIVTSQAVDHHERIMLKYFRKPHDMPRKRLKCLFRTQHCCAEVIAFHNRNFFISSAALIALAA